jgi:hypothetical protein
MIKSADVFARIAKAEVVKAVVAKIVSVKDAHAVIK